MKRIISLVLVLALALSMGTTAFATEGGEPPQEQDTTQESTVVVSTLEELQTAIDAAENEDTIAVSTQIVLDDITLETDKNITISQAEGYSGDIFRLYNGTVIKGFSFSLKGEFASAILVASSTEVAVNIENCSFVGDKSAEQHFISIFGAIYGGVNKAKIANCSFKECGDSAIINKADTETKVLNSFFIGNETTMQGAAIYNVDAITIERCTFDNNIAGSGGAVFNSGNCSVTDCAFSDNKATNETEIEKWGSDIFSYGTLNITASKETDHNFFEETTGEKIELPLTDCSSTAKLIYLTDEAAEDYFAVDWTPIEQAPIVPMLPINPAPVVPMIPLDPAPIIPTTPIEPAPVIPAIPIEPAPIIPAIPLEPAQKPDDGNNDTDDGYTPPDDYRPSHKPPKPHKPVDTIPMEEVKPVPVLACGDAVIDCSRSVVLHGYSDGQLHLENPLTRAQLATIIYRLLDEETLALYDTGDAPQFLDVPPDAWYARFLQTVNCAGIVHGVGEGNYAPDGLVTWAQIIVVLSRFSEPQDYTLQSMNYDGWALQAIQTACALGWIEDSAEFAPDAVISRGQFVELVNSVLELYR